MTLDDINSLKALLPPKRGEFLRQWMLRCVHLGLISVDEAFQIKFNNPEAWDKIYLLD